MTEVIKVKNLVKIYPGRPPVHAVNNISFSIKEGEIVGLLGPNGAGKTTTVKCICGLIEPTSGEIYIYDTDMRRNVKNGLKYISALLEGNRNIYWRLTVKENLEFFSGLAGISPSQNRSYIEKLIDFFGLNEKANTQARQLSRGMQQKLAVACCLVKRTPIILLDEPTLGLDVEASIEMRELIKKLKKEENKTILVSTHDMKLVETTCERVIIINNGKIITDDKIENLKSIFKVSAYKIEIEGKLSESIKERIKEEFISHIIEKDGGTEIDVDFRDAHRIYDFLDILRNVNVKIKSIEDKMPDFEEIFMKLIKNEGS